MRRGVRAAAWLAAAALAAACGDSEEDPRPSGGSMTAASSATAADTANRPPVVERVVLSPSEPTPGHPVEARVEVSDPDGDAVRVTFAWLVNGEVVARGRQPVLRPTGIRKGDRLEVEVTATDGRAESDPVRVGTGVGNQPPQVEAVGLLPEGPVRPGDELVAQVQASDPDGDRIRLEYVWAVNGETRQSSDAATFDTSDLQRGDRVRVQVLASDGDDRVASEESREVELANSPPVLAGLPRFAARDGVIREQLEATDPDGDHNLRFRLVEGPRGMTVDPVLGMLVWRPSAEQAGSHPVEVAVEDDHGDSSSLRFELTVSAAGTGPAEGAPPAAPAD